MVGLAGKTQEYNSVSRTTTHQEDIQTNTAEILGEGMAIRMLKVIVLNGAMDQTKVTEDGVNNVHPRITMVKEIFTMEDVEVEINKTIGMVGVTRTMVKATIMPEEDTQHKENGLIGGKETMEDIT